MEMCQVLVGNDGDVEKNVIFHGENRDHVAAAAEKWFKEIVSEHEKEFLDYTPDEEELEDWVEDGYYSLGSFEVFLTWPQTVRRVD